MTSEGVCVTREGGCLMRERLGLGVKHTRVCDREQETCAYDTQGAWKGKGCVYVCNKGRGVCEVV